VRAKIKAWIARLPKRERPLTAQQMTELLDNFERDLHQHMGRILRLALEESIYDAVSSAVQDAMSDAESTIESAIEYHMPRPDEVDLSELEDAVANMQQELRSLMTWMRME
jgi:hypothetical protein